MAASQQGHTDVVKLLLQFGTKVDAVTQVGRLHQIPFFSIDCMA